MFRWFALYISIFFFAPSITYGAVVMQVGNNTLGTGNSVPSPFTRNEKGDRITKIYSHKEEPTNTSQEVMPVIQVYPQVDLNRPVRPKTHHGAHRKK